MIQSKHPSEVTVMEVTDPGTIARHRKQDERHRRNLQWLQAHWSDLPQSRGRYVAVADGYPGAKQTGRPLKPQRDGTCILFVDGLRYDLARSLEAMLAESGCPVESEIGWAALPSVTATGKPAVSPVRHLIAGQDINVDFEPAVAETGQSLKGDYQLTKLLGVEGWQILGATKSGDPSGKAWTEFGEIDELGHKRG